MQVVKLIESIKALIYQHILMKSYGEFVLEQNKGL